MVVDAAGPFQRPDYRLARAAVAAGAHYLDIAEDASWLAGFSDALYPAAVRAGRAALAGCSTTPALVAAAVAAARLQTVLSVDSAILASGGPAGRSLIDSILRQLGKPVPGFDAGRSRTEAGRSFGSVSFRHGRVISPVSTADPALLPAAFDVRNRVTLSAGLESGAMHLLLHCLSLLVPRNGSAAPLAPLLERAQHLFVPFQRNCGALHVCVAGVPHSPDVAFCQVHVRVSASQGQGFGLPVAPVIALLRSGSFGPPGAGVCGVDRALTLTELQEHVFRLPAFSTVEWQVRHTELARGIFESFRDLPQTLLQFHRCVFGVFRGNVTVTAGRSRLARLAARLVGFPAVDCEDSPFEFTLERRLEGELWTRNVCGISSFRSLVSRDDTGRFFEAFGPVRLQLRVESRGGRLLFSVLRLSFFGLPLPRIVSCEASEFETEQKRYGFDVSLSLLGTALVRYRGSMEKVRD